MHAREINHKANNAAAKRETWRIPGKRRGGARSLKLIHYTKHPPSFPRPFPRKCSLMGNYNGSRERERGKHRLHHESRVSREEEENGGGEW